MSRAPSKTVFVGNIPYTKTEEQITDLFSSVGRVLNFRLVYDKETGRPKGFGFAEFADSDTAASAVRNLNNMEIDGRKLRVDFSNENAAGGDDDERDNKRDNNMQGVGGRGFSGGHNANGSAPGGGGGVLLPALPPGRDLNPGVTCTDAISQTINTLEPGQLLDFIRAMKDMATTDTDRAVELLTQAPQLGYATFQALLLMGLVSPETINSVIDPNKAGTLPRPPMYAQGQPAPAPVVAPPAAYGYPTATNTPPVGGFAPPPVAAPAPAAAPDQQQLIAAVMGLTQEQINGLPPAERDQILAIRAQFGA